jgi:hypothetical protein
LHVVFRYWNRQHLYDVYVIGGLVDDDRRCSSTVKIFVLLVLGTIAIGLVLVAVAGAFLFGVSETVEVGEAEPWGVTEMNAIPRTDSLAIEIDWSVANPESTYTLQRTEDPDTNDWQDIFALEPGSDAYVDTISAVYVDAEVEHQVTYYYRFYITDEAGGMGSSPHMVVTAVSPSR